MLWVADVVGVNNRTQQKRNRSRAVAASQFFFCWLYLIWRQPNWLNLWSLRNCKINVAVRKPSQGKSSSKETIQPLIKTNKAWIKNKARNIFMARLLHLDFFAVYYSFFYWHQASEKSANFWVTLLFPIY